MSGRQSDGQWHSLHDVLRSREFAALLGPGVTVDADAVLPPSRSFERVLEEWATRPSLRSVISNGLDLVSIGEAAAVAAGEEQLAAAWARLRGDLEARIPEERV